MFFFRHLCASLIVKRSLFVTFIGIFFFPYRIHNVRFKTTSKMTTMIDKIYPTSERVHTFLDSGPHNIFWFNNVCFLFFVFVFIRVSKIFRVRIDDPK